MSNSDLPKSSAIPDSGISEGDSFANPGDEADQRVPSQPTAKPVALPAASSYSHGPYASMVAPKEEEAGEGELSDDAITKVADKLEDKVTARLEDKVTTRLEDILEAKLEHKMAARLESTVMARTTDLEEQVIILRNKMDRMEYQEKEAAEREAQCKVKIEELNLRISKLEKEKNAIEGNLESLKNKKEAEIGHLKEELDSKEKENEDLKSQTKEYECVVAELRREIQALKEKLEKKDTGKFAQNLHWHYLPYKEVNDLL